MGHAVNNLGKRLAREREAERALASVLRAVIKGEEKAPHVVRRRYASNWLRPIVSLPSRSHAAKLAGRNWPTNSSRSSNESLIGNPRPDTLSSIRRRRCCPACRTRVDDEFNIKTAKHQLLLHLLEVKKMPRAYTWNEREGECVDPAAKATRIAVGDPSFDPRYAYRDLRKRKLH